MKLTLAERVRLFDILPTSGDVMTLRASARLREAVGFTDDEVKKYEVTAQVFQTPQGEQTITRWNPKFAAAETEIDVTSLQMAFVAGELKKLADTKKLRIEQLSLWEKFIGKE